MFQENKACQIFRTANISYPLIRTRTYQWVRNASFLKVLHTLFSCNARIETLPFVLLPTLGISINDRGNFDYEGKTILKIFNAFSFFFRRLENKYALGNLKKFMNNFFALRNHHDSYSDDRYCSEVTKS